MLHQHDWSESSLIVELFTRELGRIVVVAKGAKRPYSQLRAVLLPFQRLQIVAGARRGEEQAEVHTLRSAEWAGGPAMLRDAALLTGFYLNELLLKGLARHDPHALLFEAYAATLPMLAAQDDAVVQSALRAFELVLLRELGLLPQLDVLTQTQQPLDAASLYLLKPDVGIARADEGLAGSTLRALQAALDAQDLAGLQQATQAALAPLRLALRNMLHHALGVDRLRTRQVMIESQRLQAPLPTSPEVPS